MYSGHPPRNVRAFEVKVPAVRRSTDSPPHARSRVKHERYEPPQLSCGYRNSALLECTLMYVLCLSLSRSGVRARCRQKLRCARADRDYQRYGPLHQVWRMARPMAITSANKPRGEYTVKASHGRRAARGGGCSRTILVAGRGPARTITRDMTKGCELLGRRFLH